MNLLLRIKHWQLIVLLNIPLVIGFGLKVVGVSFAEIESATIFRLFVTIAQVVFFYWIYTLGINLNRRKTNPYKFNELIFSLAVFICTIGYALLGLKRVIPESKQLPLIFEMPLAFFTMFGLVFTFYNIGKSYKSMITQKKVTFSESLIDSILIFIYPIGIWSIQPRINEIFKEGKK